MATIPGVSNNELVRTTWGNAVATELNTRVVHIDGKSADGTTAQPMTGQLIILPATNVTPLVLRRPTTNIPGFEFQSTAGTVMGSIVGGTAGQVFTTAAGSFRFLIGAAELLEIIASLCKIETVTRIGAASASPLQIVDTNGGGTASTASIGFYPSATNIDTPGTIGGYVGFLGEGFQVQANLGALVLESVSSSLNLRAGAANGPIIFTCGTDEVARMSNQSMMIGQTVADPDVSGVNIFSAGAATSLKGQIRSTILGAGGVNLYCRHIGTADADNQNFVQFTRGATGTVVGSIQQNGTTGTTYGTTSDYRLKNDLGPVVDPFGKLAALAPKHLEWKDSSGEFDGFFAHEVQAVAPYAVAGDKDAVLPGDDEFNPGGIDPQQLDAAKLVPLLTAALQEAVTLIADLTARVDALEAV